MKLITTTLMCAMALATGAATAADKSSMSKAMSMDDCKVHMDMSKKAGAKHDAASMKMDKDCTTMMEKNGEGRAMERPNTEKTHVDQPGDHPKPAGKAQPMDGTAAKPMPNTAKTHMDTKGDHPKPAGEASPMDGTAKPPEATKKP
ncbi:MAG: hypothetical protein ABIQ60_03895 [Burkholderiaceae bacterium]